MEKPCIRSPGPGLYESDLSPYMLVIRASLIAQWVKNLPVLQETPVQFLGWEDVLEKEMATHSSNLAWEIP